MENRRQHSLANPVLQIIRRLSAPKPDVDPPWANGDLPDDFHPNTRRCSSTGSVRLKVPSRKFSLPPRSHLRGALPSFDDGEFNNNHKPMWLVTDYPSHPIRRGLCKRLNLSEENLRLTILSIILVCYILLGATAIYFTEKVDHSIDSKALTISEFSRLYPDVRLEDILAVVHRNVTPSQRATQLNWDFERAFTLVASTLSTVG